MGGGHPRKGTGKTMKAEYRYIFIDCPHPLACWPWCPGRFWPLCWFRFSCELLRLKAWACSQKQFDAFRDLLTIAWISGHVADHVRHKEQPRTSGRARSEKHFGDKVYQTMIPEKYCIGLKAQAMGSLLCSWHEVQGGSELSSLAKVRYAWRQHWVGGLTLSSLKREKY